MAMTIKDLSKVGEKYKDAVIRQLRQPLLEAFDIYKSNVNYGVEIETEADKAEIVAWYKRLLDKDASALESVPEKIARYIK